MEVKSLGGSSYFVTFIDDASKKVWAYGMKNKSDVFEIFKRFHAMVERQTGKLLKCLRSDNGGEYCSWEFKDYCSKHGIRHEKTVPYTPQHNGVAERMNCTILEKIRSMLSSAKLPKCYWGEAMSTACYLINRSPTYALDCETPEMVWSGKDASYSHLKVFGCKAFVHVPKEQRSKLDMKSIECIFLYYGDDEFGYKLWDPKNRKLIRSRDVVFREDQTLEDFGKDETPKQPTFEDFEEIQDGSSSTHGNEVIQDEGQENDEFPPHVDEDANESTHENMDHNNDDELDDEVIEHDDAQDGEASHEGEPTTLRRSDRPRKPSTKYYHHREL